VKLEDILNLKPNTLLWATYGLPKIVRFINCEKDYIEVFTKSGYELTLGSIYLEIATDEQIIKEININDKLLNLKTNLVETVYRLEKLDDGCYINDNNVKDYTFI
jgi:hypothetical protein